KGATTMEIGILLYDGADEMDVMGPARAFWALDDVRSFVAPFPPTHVPLVAERSGAVPAAHGPAIRGPVDYGSWPNRDRLVVAAGGVLSGITLRFHLVERLLGPQVRAAAAMAIEAETPEEVAAP